MTQPRWRYEGKLDALLTDYLAVHPGVWKDAEITACAPGEDTPTEWLRVDVLRPAVRWARGQNAISERFATFMETLCRQFDNHFHNHYGAQEEPPDGPCAKEGEPNE